MSATTFLARWRVTLGFACGAVAFALARPSRLSLLTGAPIALAGETLRVWAAGHLEKGREVTCSGPYRWFRHPLYVGSALLGAGLAVISANPIVMLLIAVYLVLTLTAAARSEERHLAEKFGVSYERYRRGDTTQHGRRFSLARARRNGEHRTIVGVAIAFALLLLRAVWP
jgi:protein-S-isoprenylcysteine O-methyltransferase Ste14